MKVDGNERSSPGGVTVEVTLSTNGNAMFKGKAVSKIAPSHSTRWVQDWCNLRSVLYILILATLPQLPIVAQETGNQEAQPKVQKSQIELTDTPKGHVVDFKGIDPQTTTWLKQCLEEKAHSKIAKRFRVCLSSADADAPSILGSFMFTGSSLRFTPRFRFKKGTNYLVKWLSDQPDPVELSFSIATEATAPTHVAHVFPSANELPENLLKFYVHFTAPMRRGDIYDHVFLETSEGVRIELPFLEIEQELWSRDGLRLMLLLDPGRIKRGLKPREEMGPILEEGRSYRLVIAPTWIDANNKPLAKEFVKTFTVGAPDNQQPNPRRWRIEVPDGGSREPLIVQLDEPCDHALLQRMFDIRSRSGSGFLESVEVGEDEKIIRVKAKEPWWPGVYHLTVSGDLEDLCGNSIERPFDVDLFEKTERSDQTPLTELEFEID